MKILCLMILVVNLTLKACSTFKTGSLTSFLFLGLSFFLIGCQDKPEDLSISGTTMGTTYHITLVSVPPSLSQASLEKDIEQILQKVNLQMSTYMDESEISRFNQSPINEWFAISDDFLQVLILSQKISALTQGKFDITIGPLIELWGFGRELTQDVPDKAAISAAKLKTGWDQLIISVATKSIRKRVPLTLNVSAIAKGYGVDKVAEYLMAKGIDNYLVEIGGEMRVAGHNSKGLQWRVGVEKPSLAQKSAQLVIQLDNQSIATSGDYRNYFESDGQRYSHTIDPDSGRPVRHNIASVTVIAQTAAEADALATALNVIGEEAALKFSERMKLAVYFIFYNNDGDEDYRIVYSSAFKRFLPVNTQGNSH